MVTVAFVLAYQIRVTFDWPDTLAHVYPLGDYARLLFLQVTVVVIALFLYKQYYIPRAISRVDQLYAVFTAVSLGTLIAVAISTFVFKGNQIIQDFPRAMLIYAWFLAIVLLLMGRLAHQVVRSKLRDYGWGRDRLLIVGSGEMAQIIIQRIQWSPYLGYELVGVVNGSEQVSHIQGVPVMGQPEDLPRLIDKYDIDEVIIAMPEKGHRETIHVLSYCERGRVSVKIFPDVFQFMTSEASIDALGGLPLLSVRDYALRGYMLIFKRMIDFFGAMMGLIFFSPLMLMIAFAIKLESPGPVFFVQERMGLDGKPFRMVKFRSMRSDAEKHGPGWTLDNDPRQTRLGRFLRKVEVDELPQLVNVLIGEMSLVGPRPEQAHYVEHFRRTVPRYMERHQEKGGMTGWAQVNGLRGDTSIEERTKYDLWYSANWSIWLDIKILLRTVWQILERKNTDQRASDIRPSETLVITSDETPPITTPKPAARPK